MVSNSDPAVSADNSVATRYGLAKKSRVSKKTGRLIAIIALIAAVLVTFWFAFSGSSSTLAYKTVGYQIHDESSAWVEFEVTKEPEATVACGLRILSDNAAIAGYRTVVLGPADDPDLAGKEMTSYYDADLRTDQLGSSGEVETCWFVEDEEAPDISDFRDY